ncbi:MAG: S41 family peptidase [Phycisphaerales bacterium]
MPIPTKGSHRRRSNQTARATARTLATLTLAIAATTAAIAPGAGASSAAAAANQNNTRNAAQPRTPNWFRHPAISPDGSTIVFVHAGDLYTVPIEGGRAFPLTVHEAHETHPVFSPDGSQIAFASDRYGNFDVFVMPSGGGTATRLTYHSAGDTPSDFTPDGKAIIFDSPRTGDQDSALFPAGVMSQLYSIPVEGGTPTRLLTSPAINARYDAQGQRIIYEDRKGYEDELRKHHTSSIARDIWIYDTRNQQHTKLTGFEGEDRDPHLTPDGRAVLFLSERAGDSNVFRMSLNADGDARAEQLTTFEHHPIRHLSVANDGHAVFSWHGELYHLPPGGQATHIPITIAIDSGSGRTADTRRSGASEFSVAESGKEIAFIVRGDVFVTSTEFGTTRRITSTPEQERSVHFAPDGRSIVYAGERDGSWNIYRATLADEDELYFFSATKINEEPLAATDDQEFQPRFSPDGKKVAFLRNRSTLRVMDLESKETITALPGTAFYSYSDGDYWYEWSPNSEWIALHYYANGRVFVGQTGVVKADGSMSEPIDISRSGYDDGTPHWSMDGEALVWSSDRYGMRSHGSWGSMRDVVAAFLTQDAYDRFTLSKEEYELQKELKEKREKEEKEDKEDEDSEDTDDADETDNAEDASDDADNGDNGDNEADSEGDENADDADDNDDKDEEEEFEPLVLELDNLDARTVRLTIHSSELGDFALSAEGDKLFYLAAFDDGYDLWVHDFRERSTKMLRKMGAGSAAMSLSEDGKTIYMLADGSLSKVDAGSGSPTPISFSAQLDIDPHAERQHLFEHVWRQTKEKFYRPDMHGVDWDFYRAQYEPKLAGIHDNYTFAELLSEILGELNASHTGGRYFGSGGDVNTATAALGILYENQHAGDGWTIAEILVGGPLDKAELPVEPGMVLTHIDGVPLTAQQNRYEPLDRKAGQRVRLTLRDARPDADPDAEPIEVVVRPVSLGQESQLRYDRWLQQRKDIVERASGGRLGYMHVRGMNDASFRELYSKTLGQYFDREALIVDTRFNGGGWLHDDLVTFLTGKRYVDLYPRDDESPDTWYMGDSMWRWTKPSIVVMSESNYSDAHFFPWAYDELDIGDTVGMPVPGTATAVWWERLHTGDLVFGIPQVGTKGADGRYLENTQLEPTHRVPLTPEDAANGRDTQLLEAVRIMLRQLDEN